MKFGKHDTEPAQAHVGERYWAKFDNGYGASIIRSAYSYGGETGLWELAVLNADDKIDYETGITDDVLGWLTEEQVADTLDQIQALSVEAIARRKVEKAERAREERIAALEDELRELKSQRSEVSA